MAAGQGGWQRRMIRKGKAAAGAAKAAAKKQQQRAARAQGEAQTAQAAQLATQAEEIAQLRAQVAALRAENEQAIVREIQREDEVRALKNEVARLRRLLPPELQLPSVADNSAAVASSAQQTVTDESAEESGKAATPTESADVAPAEVQTLCARFGIYVVGGSQTWQGRVAAACPDLKVIGSQKNFDAQQLQHADLLILNTNFVSHACINKAKDAAPRTTRVRFLSQNNLTTLYALITETFSLSL